MNTGGPASEKTLLDEFAGQALTWCLSEFAGNAEDGTQYAEAAYQIAEAMLAEKARREADHSPDAAKMVFLESANRELVEALEVMAYWVPSHNEHPKIANARAILAKHKATK